MRKVLAITVALMIAAIVLMPALGYTNQAAGNQSYTAKPGEKVDYSFTTEVPAHNLTPDIVANKYSFKASAVQSTRMPYSIKQGTATPVVNTTGELRLFYEHATVIFVGKSLTAEGGQNPIEPGALGKAMVFGPNMQNFAEVALNFVRRDGAIQVRDAAELESALAQLLSDPARREQLGHNALQVVRENLGPSSAPWTWSWRV